jgi:predicted TPR repeat methyltransferase
MNQTLNELIYRELASHYDKEVKAYSSYGHEVIFGMSFKFVSVEEKLLDIGIGTGLASIHFSEVGLKVYGLDSSQEMLDVCQMKSFTEALTQCNITKDPIPYEDLYFNHVVCCGVLHFMRDLTGLFSEVKRVMQNGGIFAFTIAPQETSADFIQEPTAWGVDIIKHAPRYIMELLETNGMELLKEQRLLIKGEDKVDFNMLFSVLICRYR